MVLVLVLLAGIAMMAATGAIAVARRKRRMAERHPFPLILPLRPAPAPTVHSRPPEPVRVDPVRMPVAAQRRSPPSVTRVTDIELPITPEEEPGLSQTVHFRRPVEQAVQLLPGRLEVVAGEKRHKEIRLVRVPGESAEVVIGRELNGSPCDVALQSATVSRRHARLMYVDGVWKVANLSQTNPVVINDEALSPARERTLVDGDCLELGEVVLRFHSR